MTKQLFPAALLALLLAACGGGGGGGSSNNSGGATGTAPSPTVPTTPPAPTVPVAYPALTFQPATVYAAWPAGKSIAVGVTADATHPADFTGKIYAYVVDQTGVILPSLSINALSDTRYAVSLQTSPNLAPGEYKGNFTVNVCRDQACTSHYPGSPMQLPYAFQVGPAAQSITAGSAGPGGASAYVGAAVAPVTVNVQAPGRSWTAASDVPWAKLDRTTGSDNGKVVVTYDTTGLKPGSYTGTLTLKADDGQSTGVALSLQVLALAFSMDQSQIAFNAVNGASIDPQAIRISYQGGVTGAWNAASDVPWLSVSPASGTAPGQATLAIAGKNGLASGIHAGKLTLSSPFDASRAIPVQLTLVAPTLSLSGSSLMLGGSLGRDSAPQKLDLALNTGANAWPWKLGALPAWASASAGAGTVGAGGTTIVLNALPDNAPVGTSTAIVNATVSVNGDTVARPVTLTLNKDQRKVLASEVGVALVSTPQWSRLQRTLTVGDNFGTLGNWSARSDKSWLSVRTSGNQLVLAADPASLPQDAVSYATVTLSTTTVGATAPEPVRVALWKGSAAPSALRKLALRYSRIVADPVRPFVYVHNGGTTIDVYNVYTRAMVATSAALGAALGDMAAGPNGDSLYVTDTASRTLVKVSLPGLEKSAAWPLPNAVDDNTHVLAIRPNGVELVLLSDGTALAAADGRLLGKSGPSGGVLAAPANGKTVFYQDQGYSPASLGGYSVDYSAMGGGTLFSANTLGAAWNSAGSNGTDIAASPDGTRVYGASGAPYRCSVYQASDLSLVGSLPGGDAYPNNVEVGSDGRVYCGISGLYSEADVWVHGADGTLLKQFKFAGYARALLARQMVVSGDGMILVGLTDDPAMAIVPVGP